MTASSHPVHPALVHFPVACWSLATAADVAGLWLGESAWLLSGSLIAVGVIMAIVSMIAGVFEFARVPEDGPAMAVALWHMGLATAALMLYACSLLLRFDHQAIGPPGRVAISLSLAGFVALLLAAWFGGALVYRYGVGVRPR